MVCMLHTLGQGGILASCEVSTIRYDTFWLAEIFCYCAVDGFALISGYTAADKPKNYSKIVDMWFQAFFYSFVLTIVLTLVGIGQAIDSKTLITYALPVTYKAFWYFTAYFVLFFAMPVLNKFLFSIDEIMAKKTLIIIVILFSVLGVLAFSVLEVYADPFSLGSGYSAIWVMVLYCIGVLAKRAKLFENKNSYILIILWAVCIALTWVNKVFFGDEKLLSYVSPTILLSGIIMVVLFSRLKPNPKVIGKLSPLAFGIYLFQTSPVIWSCILKDAVATAASISIVPGMLCVFGAALSIFAVGMLVEFIRVKLSKLFRISVLSEKIVELTDTMLTKMSVLLK